MRNISFSLTTQQIRDKTKTVTRRMGWWNLKPGELLQGCEKCMGRRNGEPLVKLNVIRVVSVRRESLNSLTRHAETGALKVAVEGAYYLEEAELECKLEGFPDKSPEWFVDMFCRSHKGCTPDSEVNRIEFEYL